MNKFSARSLCTPCLLIIIFLHRIFCLFLHLFFFLYFFFASHIRQRWRRRRCQVIFFKRWCWWWFYCTSTELFSLIFHTAHISSVWLNWIVPFILFNLQNITKNVICLWNYLNTHPQHNLFICPEMPPLLFILYMTNKTNISFYLL